MAHVFENGIFDIPSCFVQLDNEDAGLEREGMQQLAIHRSRRETDQALINDPKFKTYKGRLWTFMRPMMVLLQVSLSVFLCMGVCLRERFVRPMIVLLQERGRETGKHTFVGPFLLLL